MGVFGRGSPLVSELLGGPWPEESSDQLAQTGNPLQNGAYDAREGGKVSVGAILRGGG